MGKKEGKSGERFPDGTLLMIKDEGEVKHGRVRGYDATKGRYTVAIPIYEVVRCCGASEPTEEYEEIITKKVRALAEQAAVTLRGIKDIPALNGQTAMVSKYLGSGQYQCMVLSVVEGFAGGSITLKSQNLVATVKKKCTCEKTLSPRSLKRKREVPEEIPETVEDYETVWDQFSKATHESLTMEDIPWPDDINAIPTGQTLTLTLTDDTHVVPSRILEYSHLTLIF